jgi:hypothetical protein
MWHSLNFNSRNNYYQHDSPTHHNKFAKYNCGFFISIKEQRREPGIVTLLLLLKHGE